MRHELERIEIQAEHDARGRTWRVVESAFGERQPVERVSNWPRVAAVALALAALLAAALSPPGRAVLDEVREVVGVERAQPALFSLPAPGRLLVASDAGVWIVQRDGSKRLLGNYREASWSPFGRYVVAARENELAALEPNGDVRWTLARPGVRSPRWAGTETDTRIVYVDRTGLRIVAGDGTGDRLLVRGFRGELAWRPGEEVVLAYATSRELRVVDLAGWRTLWQRSRTGAVPTHVQWSADGRRLVVVGPRSLVVYDERGAAPLELGPGVDGIMSAALAPSGRSLVYGQDGQTRSQIWVVPRIRPDGNAARRLFSGAGRFDRLTWTSDGEWILVSWPTADQWIFIRANGAGLRAVSSISEQFRSRAFPRVEGWCCVP